MTRLVGTALQSIHSMQMHGLPPANVLHFTISSIPRLGNPHTRDTNLNLPRIKYPQHKLNIIQLHVVPSYTEVADGFEIIYLIKDILD